MRQEGRKEDDRTVVEENVRGRDTCRAGRERESETRRLTCWQLNIDCSS